MQSEPQNVEKFELDQGPLYSNRNRHGETRISTGPVLGE
jgi:hypothetical protein